MVREALKLCLMIGKGCSMLHTHTTEKTNEEYPLPPGGNLKHVTTAQAV